MPHFNGERVWEAFRTLGFDERKCRWEFLETLHGFFAFLSGLHLLD